LHAPLDAPADPELPHTPRPEWYLLFLFELRRYFSGSSEFVVTIFAPLAVLGLLISMPFIDRKCSHRASMALRWFVVVAGVGGWVGLTLASAARDWRDEEFQASRQQAIELARRARTLADQELIPPEGAMVLLHDDPYTQGPLLFARHCASCHSHLAPDGQGIQATDPSAPNLHGFASRDWIAGLLDVEQFASPHYFGKTKLLGGEMFGSLTELFEGAADAADKVELRVQLKKAALALSAAAALPAQAESDQQDAAAIDEGVQLIVGELDCISCHRFGQQGELGSAPDLTGYGSREWLKGMISNPLHERFYPEERNDRMPAFAENSENPDGNLMTDRELNLLVDWLRGTWYRPPAEP